VSLWLHLVIVYYGPAEAVFATVPLSISDWMLILPVSASILILDELRKYFFAGMEQM
jgi:Ca2+-transporting ATPase